MGRIQCIMKMKLQVASGVKMEDDQIIRKLVIMHKGSPEMQWYHIQLEVGIEYINR